MRRRVITAVAASAAALAWIGPADVSTIGSGSAAAAGEPTGLNVVLVLTDDQGIESLDRMPYISGRGSWVRFDHAFVNNPLCCPSRATILSGRYSHHTGVEGNQDGGAFDDAATVATWLDDAGYRTAFVGKYLNEYPFGSELFVPPGWDYWKAFTGTADYFDYSLAEARNGRAPRVRTFGSEPKHYSTDVLATKASKLIERFDDDPFFLMYAPFAAHGPRHPAPRHAGSSEDIEIIDRPNVNEADVSDKPAWVQAREPVNVDRMHRLQRQEYETLLSVDDAVRNLFRTLRRSGHEDDTIVVFLTDNGYSYGSHRWEKKHCPYEECIATPLLVHHPGVAGRHEPALASNVDLAPTILDAADVPVPVSLDGASLLPVITLNGPGPNDALLVHNRTLGDWWGVRTTTHKYVEYGTGERELYDLVADPYELDNVAGRPEYAAVEAELAARLAVLRL